MHWLNTRILILFTISLAFTTSVNADVGSEYGFGPISGSLAGNSVAWDFNGYAGYNNPAGLPLIDRAGSIFHDARFILSYGIIYMDPEFSDISNVVISNKYWGNDVSGNNYSTGNVDNSYKSVFGQEIGMAYRINPEWHNLTLGVTLFFPFEQLAYLDSGETYEPEYVLYRSNGQQPDLTFSAGGEITKNFRAGLGLHVAYNLSTSASGTIQATNPSTERFTSDIKPKASPYLGFHYMSDDEKKTAGLVMRFANSEDSKFNVNTGAQPIGSFPNIPVSFLAGDTIIYSPFTVQLGGSLQTAGNGRTYFQLDYQHWNAFSAPYLMITNPCAGVGCGVTVQKGPQLDVKYRDIFVPRLGHQITRGNMKYRFGYGYRPGIISDPTSGIGNYLDPSKHLFNAGVGFEFERFFGYKKPWNLDFSLEYQQFVTQTVTKTPGDEAGDLTSKKIGAPGYDAGGHVIGGQIALSVGM